jgi:hypothetical protein
LMNSFANLLQIENSFIIDQVVCGVH